MVRVTSLEDRVTFGELAQAGYTDCQVAQQTGWSVFTVRKWRRRGQRRGRKGLTSRRGRPCKGALSTFPPLIRETLSAWRRAHPGWGPKTLRVELELDPRFSGQALPERSSIARFLKEQGLTRRYERHRELPQPHSSVAQVPHEE